MPIAQEKLDQEEGNVEIGRQNLDLWLMARCLIATPFGDKIH